MWCGAEPVIFGPRNSIHFDTSLYYFDRANPHFSPRRTKKPPHRAIKLSVSNNLMAREAAAWNRQSVALNN
jgi:hypothetical protein